MVKEVIHDPIFLGVKSEKATKEDFQAAQDLLDTLIAHKDSCVGMVANMIGVRKRIIVFDNEGTYMTMFNPEIIKKSGPYDAEEVVFLCWAPHENANAIRPSKFDGKPQNSKSESKPSLVGWRRLSNTRLIIAKGY